MNVQFMDGMFRKLLSSKLLKSEIERLPLLLLLWKMRYPKSKNDTFYFLPCTTGTLQNTNFLFKQIKSTVRKFCGEKARK